METKRSEFGLELEAALREVLSHVRGESTLPDRIVDAAEQILAERRRLKQSRQ